MSKVVASVKQVSSRTNPLLMRLRKRLGDPGAYRKQGDFLLEGDHLCSAYLQRGVNGDFQALVSDVAWGASVFREMAQAASSITVMPEALMATISSLECPPQIAFLVPWLVEGRVLPKTATVVLDRLQDPGNVGAILRSAAAFGFVQVLALKGTCAMWSPKVLRAGMGAHFGLRLMEGVDWQDLEALNVPLLATSSHATDTLQGTELPWPCAWVVGHEGQGICDGLMQRCSQTLRIPQPGGEESLNVASAAAVCFYESVRLRAR
jgi:RNA methyltransferase, TrmH family